MEIDNSEMIVPGIGSERIHLNIVEFYMHIYLPLYLSTSHSDTDVILA